MLEEQLKNEIAVKYFKKFVCTDIIKRIDFSVKNDYGYLLWAEAKQQPTDIYKMLAQLLITIKLDAWDMTPPKFLGCFDSEKIAFVLFYDVQPVFALNDFNWTQTPSQVDDKTVETVRNTIDKNKIFTFRYGEDDINIHNFIKQNFNENFEGNFLATQIDKNNFIFVYQKWRKAIMPYINAPWEKLKKDYSVYDRDFFLAELNIDDNGTADISDDKTVYEDFYITFDASNKKPYQLFRTDNFGMDSILPFGFKNGGLEHYAEFWKLYKRPPKEEIWKHIISRLDLLVPQDVRERKGAYFTPQIWVEKSQEYIADVLGADWQDEYYIWDCCAGTGNLLNGLTNKYRIFASTIDQQDVDVMKERIKNGANLLESHVFRFDFLNDDLKDEKMPEDLKKIVFDPEKRRKLVIYINPPYAEVSSVGLKGKAGVNQSKIHDRYQNIFGTAGREIFIQFLWRCYAEIKNCYIAEFSKLKILQGAAFEQFRNNFTPILEKMFVVPAWTFDNVKGNFPIGFKIWNTNTEKRFDAINSYVYDENGNELPNKLYCNVTKTNVINKWISSYKFSNNTIGFLCGTNGNDFQQNGIVYILNDKCQMANPRGMWICHNNLIVCSIYFAVRKTSTSNWINDRDQFLFPNDGWKNDLCFQTNCLVWTLFNNNIQSKFGVNHWIPFSEEEVNSKALFDSHFMKDFLDGKIKQTQNNNGDLFADDAAVGTRRATSLQYSDESKSVLSAGRELWKYYHTKDAANPNASLYDIKEFFQGRNESGKMNTSSDDPVYTKLLADLKTALRALGETIKPKVYEYGFLR